MPDTLALTVSTGVSFGLLAGIVSGVCYLVANGFTWPIGREHRRRLQSDGGGEEGRGGRVCGECGRQVEDSDSDDYPCPCACGDSDSPVKFEEGRWFLKQVQRTLKYIPWSISTDKLDSIGRERRRGSVPSGAAAAAREARSVRDFMEQLSERLAGGALDRTSVAAVYNHPSYESMFSRHHTALRDALAALALALRGAITNLPAVRDADDGGEGAEAVAESEQPSASGAHARLKRLVQRVIEEAMALPALAHYAQAHHHKPAESAAAAFDARTYEDLLATAILNKVIERYQAESTGGRSGGASSGIHSASASPTPSAPSSSTTTSPDSPHTPPPLHDEDDEDERSDSEWEHDGGREDMPALPRRVPFPEFGGDIIHYSESLGELDDQHLEELSGSDLQAVEGSWEENWLFQRKKVKSLQSVPVPMLVPNSNADYKAMIGDRDADDTTDLSDAATDTEDELEYKSDIGRTIYSKSVIGGKTPTDQLLTIETSVETINSTETFTGLMNNGNAEIDSNESQSILKDVDSSTEVQEVTAEFKSSNDSVVVVDTDSGPLPKAEFAVDEIHRTNPNTVNVDEVDGFVSTVNAAVVKENSISLNNHQQDGEYEETITKPVQRYADSLRKQHYPNGSSEDTGVTANTENIGDDLIPGSIADRERKKWLNYVEMPNNPYSAEAIQKRLSNKSSSTVFDFLTTKTNIDDKKTNEFKENNNKEDSKEKSLSPKVLKDVLAEEVPQYKRYGRDYYINEAKRSAGARKSSNLSSASSLCSINKATSLDQFDTNEFTSPGLLIKQFNSMSSVKETEPETNIMPTIANTTTNTHKNNENIISIEYEDVTDQSLFSAKPVYIDDDTDEKFEDIMKSATQICQLEVNISDSNLVSPLTTMSNGIDESLLSTSSLDDSIKIYNVTTGEIVKNSQSEQATGRDSLYNLDKNDNIVTSDKNYVEKYVNSAKNDRVTRVAFPVGKMINGSESQTNLEDSEIQLLPKVKDLAKKFVKIDNNDEPHPTKSTPRRRKFSNDYELEVVSKSDPKHSGKHMNYMHSLTARSISKEFREELKLSMATPLKVPGGTNAIPEGTEEITRETSNPPSPVPEPGTLKNKLAFFESLKF